MGWYPNKCAKVDDGSEFSVTEYYEKVCVPEGAIPIVIDVPRLRHVGPIRGAASIYLPTGTRLPDCRHHINLGPIYDVLPRDFRSKKIGILPASIFMPTVLCAIVRSHTNAKIQKT